MIQKLALTLPGGQQIPNPPGFRAEYTSLGSVLSATFNVALFAAGFLMVVWLFWGIFQYIFAGGSKEGLAKARQRITWALVGFIIFIISFALSQWIQTLVPQSLPRGIQSISLPEEVPATPTNP